MDEIGQAIADFAASAERLKDLVVIENPKRPQNLDRMANHADFDAVCHAMTQGQVVASQIEVRMIANAEVV